ncbi:urease accessory protein UreD [Svornostia abyssi]|uniref:urease accessory protein UreD n=1 Tax=Svornostia abyssi TaxID=2898438 RepID=UPI00338F317F
MQTAASLLAGDRLEIDVRCGPGARLRLVDVAALVAHDVRGGEPAQVEVRLEVGARARLEWEAQPLVLAAGSAVRRHTEVELRRGAAALLRDTLVLGRAGELAGRLSTHTDVRHESRPLHAEALDTGDVGLLRSPGGAGQREGARHARALRRPCRGRRGVPAGGRRDGAAGTRGFARGGHPRLRRCARAVAARPAGGRR